MNLLSAWGVCSSSLPLLAEYLKRLSPEAQCHLPQWKLSWATLMPAYHKLMKGSFATLSTTAGTPTWASFPWTFLSLPPKATLLNLQVLLTTKQCVLLGMHIYPSCQLKDMVSRYLKKWPLSLVDQQSLLRKGLKNHLSWCLTFRSTTFPSIQMAQKTPIDKMQKLLYLRARWSQGKFLTSNQWPFPNSKEIPKRW